MSKPNNRANKLAMLLSIWVLSGCLPADSMRSDNNANVNVSDTFLIGETLELPVSSLNLVSQEARQALFIAHFLHK